jgi:predicted transcriptional regulator of viral defense system
VRRAAVRFPPACHVPAESSDEVEAIFYNPQKVSCHGEYEKPWTFITNHAAVFSLLTKHSRITAREISHEIGITERSVRMIISDLDKSGYISKIGEGRSVRYLVDLERHMRHKTQRNVNLIDLMSILV